MRTPAKAESIRIEDVIKLVAEGRLRLPSFQRPFRWESSDRRELLDSIYRGYPIGTLLLWKNPPHFAEGTTRPLGNVAMTPVQGDTFLVIDGQQRIATLWDALGRKPNRQERSLVFDMVNEEFRFRPATREELDEQPPKVMDNQPPPVPLHLVLDAAALSEWTPQELSREERRQYFELGKRIRDYSLTLYVVEEADLNLLRHVFDRVNTKGKPMTREEVFDALIGSQVVDQGATGLELVNTRIQDLGFGKLERTLILKAFEAVRGTKIGLLDRDLDVGQAGSDLLRTATALREVIVFLRDIAAVPHIQVMPYELPIVVLARFFSLYPRPHERSLILLRRWLWRGFIAGRLASGSGAIQQHTNDIVERDEHGSVQALLRRSGSPKSVDPFADFVSDFSIGSARGLVAVCAALSQRPRDLTTGEQIDVAELFRDGKANLLKSIVTGSSDALAGSLANKLIHPTTRQTARRLILGCTDGPALFSHGISATSADALRTDKIPQFLEQRSDVLKGWIRAHFERQAELSRDDSPPVAALSRRSA